MKRCPAAVLLGVLTSAAPAGAESTATIRHGDPLTTARAVRLVQHYQWRTWHKDAGRVAGTRRASPTVVHVLVNVPWDNDGWYIANVPFTVKLRPRLHVYDPLMQWWWPRLNRPDNDEPRV